MLTDWSDTQIIMFLGGLMVILVGIVTLFVWEVIG